MSSDAKPQHRRQDSSGAKPRSINVGQGGEKYQKMIAFLANNIAFPVNLAHVSDKESLGTALVTVFGELHRPLHYLTEMIRVDFELSGGADRVLRPQGVTSRILGLYVRKVGSSYLQTLLAELVTSVVKDETLEFEVNESNVDVPDGGNLDAIVARNAQQLCEYCTRLIDRLVEPSMINLMPREIRALANCIYACAEASGMDKSTTLVSNFIMLRFFNAAVANPEAYDLLTPDVFLSDKARRNLLLLSKLLRGVAVGVDFGTREHYMSLLNPFVRQHNARLRAYLTAVGADPLRPDEGEKAPDFVPFAEFHEHEPVEPGTIDVREFALDDLITIHRQLDAHSAAVLVAVQSAHLREGQTPTAQKHEFVALMTEIGLPPEGASTSRSKARARASESDLRRHSVATRRDHLLEVSYQNYLEHSDKIDTSAYDEAGFFYSGKPDRAGVATFYFLVRAIAPGLLDDIDAFVLHLFKIFGTALNSPYAIVVDMSWATLANDSKQMVFDQLASISKSFSRKQKKNLTSLYIIHPTSFVRNVMWVVQPFVSSKLKRKIHMIYDWKNLAQFFDLDDVCLPSESKNVMTKIYKVVKVNARGKRQERWIKLTGNSLLNIDRKSGTIKNEKLFSALTLAAVDKKGEPGLQMKFTEDDVQRNPPVGYFLQSRSSAADLESRLYICSSAEERDQILKDVLEAAIRSESLILPQAFKGIEINALGKRKDRILKLTLDSLMKLKDNKIRQEIHFDGIEAVAIDEENPNIVNLKYKFEMKGRQFETPQAAIMFQSIKDAMHRCSEAQRKQNDAVDEEMKNRAVSSFGRGSFFDDDYDFAEEAFLAKKDAINNQAYFESW